MKNPHVIWAATVIVVALVTGGVLLSFNDKPLSDLLALAAMVVVPVLSGLGIAMYQKLEQVKDNVNGNKAGDRLMIKELQDTVKELAMKMTPPEEK